jgi:hypothetical protein
MPKPLRRYYNLTFSLSYRVNFRKCKSNPKVMMCRMCMMM